VADGGQTNAGLRRVLASELRTPGCSGGPHAPGAGGVASGSDGKGAPGAGGVASGSDGKGEQLGLGRSRPSDPMVIGVSRRRRLGASKWEADGRRAARAGDGAWAVPVAEQRRRRGRSPVPSLLASPRAVDQPGALARTAPPRRSEAASAGSTPRGGPRERRRRRRRAGGERVATRTPGRRKSRGERGRRPVREGVRVRGGSWGWWV
jgi:hypothetical protein